MRLRIAKKVLGVGSNSKYRKNYLAKYKKLRPIYVVNKNGKPVSCMNSWNDLPLIKAAWQRMRKHFKKHENEM